MACRRSDAWKLLNEHTTNPNLIKHGLAVEAAMRAYADHFGEDADKWGITGLLHDFDYERFPDEHPMVGEKILREKGYPEDIIHAIQAHAPFTGVPRVSPMDKALFAVDELCGFLVAVTLVRPGKRIADVPPKSVKKKLKDKAFAKNVSREDIHTGAAELGQDITEHIQFVTAAMATVADELGLAGDEDEGSRQN